MKMREEVLEPHTVPHHRLAELHRDMTEQEFDALKLSIEEIGQIEPVKVYKGKLVDGRHRQQALIELGIHDMKAHILPGNMSLKDVKEAVLGTEQRRSDTVAQKAIRAYKYAKNEPDVTFAEAAVKFGVDASEISRAKKVEDRIGSVELEKLYTQGYIYFGDRRHTTLKSIIRDLNTKRKDQQPQEPLNDVVKDIFEKLVALNEADDKVSIAQIESYAKKLRTKE